MTQLNDRVAIITGAGRGIGREHALFFASRGARVVVNDLGAPTAGASAGTSPAHEVVDEIRAQGGTATANTEDVSTWSGAQRLVERTIAEYGTLDILVNNAGILRDAFITDMTEKEWNDVIRVNLTGHAAVLHHAAAHWKARAKAGHTVNASVVNTSSGSGSTSVVPRETNYAATKAGILALTQVAAAELGRWGVRVNAITPLARTRLTLAAPGLQERLAKPASGLDTWDPAAISPLVAFLAEAECTLTGRVFAVQGGRIEELGGWHPVNSATSETPWTVEQIRALDWDGAAVAP